jgi:hypothetical protein
MTMRPLATVDPRIWAALAPHYAALSAQRLAPGDVPTWLAHWSDVREVVWEGWTGAKAAQEHDLADAAAQTALQRFTDEVLTPSEVAAGEEALRFRGLRRVASHPGSEARSAAPRRAGGPAPLDPRASSVGATSTFVCSGTGASHSARTTATARRPRYSRGQVTLVIPVSRPAIWSARPSQPASP